MTFEEDFFFFVVHPDSRVKKNLGQAELRLTAYLGA